MNTFVRAGSRRLNTTTTVTPQPLDVSRTTLFCPVVFFQNNIPKTRFITTQTKVWQKKNVYQSPRLLSLTTPPLSPPPTSYEHARRAEDCRCSISTRPSETADNAPADIGCKLIFTVVIDDHLAAARRLLALYKR